MENNLQNPIQKKNVLQDVAPPAKLTGKEIVYKYIVFLPLFIISVGISLSIAYINLRYKVPIYGSTISLLIKDDRSSRGGGEDLILENLTTYKKRTNLSNESEILRSSVLMSRVVRMLNLNWQYYNQGSIKTIELYGNTSIHANWVELKDSTVGASLTLVRKRDKIYIEYGPGRYKNINSGDIIDFFNGKMKVFFDPNEIIADNKYLISYSPTMAIAGGLAGALQVRPSGNGTSILILGMNSEVPQKSRDILNALTGFYNQLNIEDKNKIVDNTIKFIDERLEVLTREFAKIENELREFRIKNGFLDLQQQESVDFSISQTSLIKKDEQFNIRESIEFLKDYISTPQKKYDLAISMIGLSDVTLQGLINEYNQLQESRAVMLKTVPLDNPIVKLKNHQIDKVRERIYESLSFIRKGSNFQDKIEDKKFDRFQNKLHSLQNKEEAYQDLLRQRGIKERQYLFLLEKRETSELTRASTIGNSEALEGASSFGPISPDVSGTYKNAFIIGFVLPIIFIYLLDLLNDKIIVRNDIARITPAPIIGEVAHHASQNRVLVVSNKDRSVLAEQFRILRTNLGYLIGVNIKTPVLLVTSSIAGEGKTFCSMNLAAVWGIAGKKTVILELDLRKPKIAKSLGLINEKGITHFMLGQVSAEDLPIPIPNTENLYIVPAGIIPPNPSEMIMDPRMNEFLNYLKSRFDLIIIDSAPVGLVSDSKIIGKLADATIYIIRQRFTVKKQIPFIDELYKQDLLPNIGILVNDVKIGGINSYYGYGYGYGYGYSYNYTYNYRYGSENISLWTKLKSLFKI